MSLRVCVALEVLPMGEDAKFIQITRTDTAVNPNPEDIEAELLVAEKLFERLIDDVRREAQDRFREYKSALEKLP
jgi:hypothetical protein